jgi:phosphoenolpyruvate carboxykinase (GTP)
MGYITQIRRGITMVEYRSELLKNRLGDEDYHKLMAIDNPEMHEFVAGYIELCNPDRVFVTSDSTDDIQYVRKAAIRNGEEERLSIEEHTIHFDGYSDQAK